MKESFTLMVVGGKTGGHLFSGIAVAQALVEIAPHARVVFLGTDSDFERHSLKPWGFTHKAIAAAPMKGKGLGRKIAGIGILFLAFVQSLGMMLTYKPDVVMGVGGYVSFAPIMAAFVLGIPRTIQEQNAYPGLANRVLAPLVQKVFTGFESIAHIPAKKICYTGTPVRKMGKDPVLTDIPGQKKDDFLVVVTGGSQGASSMNRAVMKAMEELAEEPQIFVVHQTGAKEEKSVQKFYEKKGFPVLAKAFFPRMPDLFRKAQIVVARSGAGTVAELCTAGTAAILVPYPHATDDHQNANARQLVNKGGAIMIPDNELSGERLVRLIKQLKENPQRLQNMGAAMNAMAKPCAAESIARVLLKMGKSRTHVSA